MTKVGAGTLTLSGANAYTGTTTVLAGILRVTGSLAGAVNVQGGVLGGNGMFNGGAIVGPGGVVAPGASIGALETTGLLSLEADAVFELEIDSTVRVADHITADGLSLSDGARLTASDLGSALLSASLTLEIVDNTSVDPVGGTFSGLGEGTQFSIGENLFAITYHGGDGNNVVLTSFTVPEPSSAILLLTGVGGWVARRKRPSW